MTMVGLIRAGRKTESVGVATAIPATQEEEGEERATAARIATVAVANPRGEKPQKR